MIDLLNPDQLTALLTVIGIDLVLSGDNAVIIGTAAAGLPPRLRHRAIVIGLVGATVLRIIFAATAFYLLKIIGLLLAGGLLLLWVAWMMWRQIRREAEERRRNAALDAEAAATMIDPGAGEAATTKRFRNALWAIIIADVSMSLDNVLAVAGAAKDHLNILIFGLALSIALMGLAANYIARIMDRYGWIAYVGVALIAYVALDMIWRGGLEVFNEVQAAMLSAS